MTRVLKPNCNLDYQLALSVATYEETLPVEEASSQSSQAAAAASSQAAAFSTAAATVMTAAAAAAAATAVYSTAAAAATELSMAAASSSSMASFTSSDMPLMALPEKKLCSDWLDDRSTNCDPASPRSVRSFCDEPEVDEFELVENEEITEKPARKLTWAELADSDTDDDTNSVDAEGGSEAGDAISIPEMNLGTEGPRARWADISESDEEFKEFKEKESEASPVDFAPPPVEVKELEPQSVQPYRASRRARAAAADDRFRGKGAVDEQADIEPAQKVARASPPGKGSGKKGSDWTENAASKSAAKASGKGTKGTGKGTGKSAGKGASQGYGKAGGKGKKGAGKGKGAVEALKYQCQIIVGIDEDNKFRVVRRLIGSGGEHMKRINQETQARLRLRGRGSKFLEGDEQQESTDDLMLCITSHEQTGYEAAKEMAAELIEGLHHSYRAFCHKAGKACPDLKLQIHEGYREGSR